MATYITSIRSPLAAEKAFDYVADVEHFAEWDPGVTESVQVEGDGPGLGAAYDVTVRNAGRSMTLRYEVVAYDPPHQIVLHADTGRLVSHDTITVGAQGSGSVVVYEAELTLKGIARLAEPGLALAFDRIGDKAAAGLRRALGADESRR